MNELDTTIRVVTVYPDRARVTRSGSAALDAGRQVMEVKELPLGLGPDSVRASARGTARARLLGVEVQRAIYAETPAQGVRELEVQIEAVQDEMRLVDGQSQIVGQQRGVLDGLAGRTETYAIAWAAGEQSLEAELAMFDGLRGRAEALDRELVELAARKRELERRLQQLKGQLEQLRGARPRQRHTVRVEVEVSQAGELSVDLSYVVTGAGWKPLYDLRLVEAGGAPALEATYLAQVTQNTGEAWEGVSLSLSTARPALASVLPELKPWYVRPQPVMPLPRAEGMHMAVTAAPLRAKAAPDLAAAPAEAPQEVAPVQAATAAVESAGAAITYRVPGNVDIPSDGAPHKVTVAEMELPPRLDYVSAPRLVPAAYRRARLTNDSPYLLLPGPANLFAGDEFIGATHLELTPPQGEIELYLGVDDRIKVEREPLRRDVDKTLIGGKRRVRYAYQITLENHLGAEAKLNLQDQIPVAGHEAIKVRLESAEPKPAKQSELNILEWELALAPKEKRLVRFDFSVEYPPEMQLSGLP